MFRLEWLGLVVLVTATVALTPHRGPSASCTCAPSETVVEPARVDRSAEVAIATADLEYRRGEAARAAQTIRAIAETDELRSLAELYQAFASAYDLAMDPEVEVTDAFVGLRRAQSLDIALGGAFADGLYARMRVIAPRASRAYAAAHATRDAALAQHTAETYGTVRR